MGTSAQMGFFWSCGDGIDIDSALSEIWSLFDHAQSDISVQEVIIQPRLLRDDLAMQSD